jgi:hypothetical protein
MILFGGNRHTVAGLRANSERFPADRFGHWLLLEGIRLDSLAARHPQNGNSSPAQAGNRSGIAYEELSNAGGRKSAWRRRFGATSRCDVVPNAVEIGSGFRGYRIRLHPSDALPFTAKRFIPREAISAKNFFNSTSLLISMLRPC